MSTFDRHEVALNVARWAKDIQRNDDTRAELKDPSRIRELAVSDGKFVKSSSGLTHSEYLHLRTVWYRYQADSHISDFAKLLKNDDKTGYKGFVSPENNDRAAVLVTRPKISPYLEKYLAEIREAKARRAEASFSKEKERPRLLHPSPECGYFAMARYWQIMATTHTKQLGPGRSKIVKHGVVEEARGRSTTPDGQHGLGKPSNATTPPRQITSNSGSPSKLETPAATSHPTAKGGVKNPPSADEAYVNVALLLLLQAVSQHYKDGLPELHWVPPRMALRCAVPIFDSAEQIFKRKLLFEAQVDGYLCDATDDGGLGRPMAICEAKSGTRSSVLTGTERQEAGEMAAWICSRPGGEGLLQSSNSGKKRRLMISQDRDEIYIIIGEYGASYERYIRNSPWKVGDHAARPEPLTHVNAPLAQEYEETLGSPTFLKLRAREEIEIDGWKVPAKKDDDPPPPPGGPSGNATNQGISGQLPVRPKVNKVAGSKPVTRSATPQALNLPKVDGFLVMHRFGPWKTDDEGNMQVFVRRLLALMLQLNENKETMSPPNDESSSAASSRAPSTTGFRTSSATGSRAPSATGNRAPSNTRPLSAAGSRPPSATGNRPPSATDNRTSSTARLDSASGNRGPSATGDRAPSATGRRALSTTGSRASSTTGSRASSASGDRGRPR